MELPSGGSQDGWVGVGGPVALRAELEQALVSRLVSQLEELAERLRRGPRPSDFRALDSACSVLADELVGMMGRQEVALAGRSGPGQDRLLRSLAMQRSTISELTSVARQLRVGLEEAEPDHLVACRACLRELCVALLVHQRRELEALSVLATPADT